MSAGRRKLGAGRAEYFVIIDDSKVLKVALFSYRRPPPRNWPNAGAVFAGLQMLIEESRPPITLDLEELMVNRRLFAFLDVARTAVRRCSTARDTSRTGMAKERDEGK